MTFREANSVDGRGCEVRQQGPKADMLSLIGSMVCAAMHTLVGREATQDWPETARWL